MLIIVFSVILCIFLAIIATCWATFMHFGMEGYVEATRQIVQTTKYIEKG